MKTFLFALPAFALGFFLPAIACAQDTADAARSSGTESAEIVPLAGKTVARAYFGQTTAPPSWIRPLTPPVKPATRWYGWQTMLALAPADVLLIASLNSDTKFFSYAIYPSIALHLLAGPVVHSIHEQPGRAGAALVLNIVMPVAGFLGGLGTRSLEGLVFLGGLGVVGAHVIDVAALSWEKVEPASTTAHGWRALLPSSVAVVPSIGTNMRGMSVIGRF